METINTLMPRKGFLGTFAASAALFGIAPLSVLGKATNPGEADNAIGQWFEPLQAKKHKVVYDVPEPHGLFPFAWPKVFLLSNEKSGSKIADCGVVVVLRHSAICYAMESRLWEKYSFGEAFKAPDPKTEKPSIRNPFWQPQPGDFKVPGVGEVKIGINELQAEGVMFCVCDMAITVMSAVVSNTMKLDHDEVRKDWKSGLLPGIQLVPSGVWALGRAQEVGCGYIKA